jgi:selenocysteine-specific elongation factor
MRTIGGGVVIDPAPAHRRQRPAVPVDAMPARLERLVYSSGLAGVPAADLPIRLGVAPAEVPSLIAAAQVVSLGNRLAAEAAIAAGVAEALRIVDAHHSAHRLEPGLPVQELRARIGGASELIQAVLDRAAAEGRLHVAGAFAMRAGWTPTPSREQLQVADRMLKALRAAGREPPSVVELAAENPAHVFSILKFQEREGLVVQVSADRFYEAGVLRDMVGALREGMRDGRTYAPQEIRDIIGVSRKFLIPFLEYCDRSGVTERQADGRVLTGTLRDSDRQVLA